MENIQRELMERSIAMTLNPVKWIFLCFLFKNYANISNGLQQQQQQNRETT